MKSLQKRRSTALILAVVWLAVCLVLTLAMGQTKATEDYEIKLLAAQKLQGWMDDIRDYKLEAGLSLTPYDTHKTGMIGDEYTPITTSLGSEEAKRTTANPDMGALLVQMLTEAGVKSGDTIGAGFSGSFPTLNLAVLAAGEAMNVKVIYIASMGASTFGANQPQFTFPDMVCRLYLDGRLQTPPALITPGGDYDCGGEMFEEEKEEALARIASYGVADIMQERDFAANLKAREDLYETLGPISCFVGVGGNITTIGLEEDKMKAGVMVPYTVTSVRSDDGLLQYYNAHGLPVLHLLNIKQLAAQYGLPFDPEMIVPPGQSALYYFKSFVFVWHTVTVAFSFNINMDSGRPTTMLRPTITARFPSIGISNAFNTSMTASAVHGAKPSFSPANTFAVFTAQIPSRSFSGRIICSARFSLIYFGSGRNNRIPSMASSSLIFWNSAKNSSSVISAGYTYDFVSIPYAAIRFMAFLS